MKVYHATTLLRSIDIGELRFSDYATIDEAIIEEKGKRDSILSAIHSGEYDENGKFCGEYHAIIFDGIVFVRRDAVTKPS